VPITAYWHLRLDDIRIFAAHQHQYDSRVVRALDRESRESILELERKLVRDRLKVVLISTMQSITSPVRVRGRAGVSIHFSYIRKYK